MFKCSQERSSDLLESLGTKWSGFQGISLKNLPICYCCARFCFIPSTVDGRKEEKEEHTQKEREGQKE